MTPQIKGFLCGNCWDWTYNHAATLHGFKCLWLPDFFMDAQCLNCDQAVLEYEVYCTATPIVTCGGREYVLHQTCYMHVKSEANDYGGWVSNLQDAVEYLLKYK